MATNQRTVLLAEDNPADVYLIREALSVNGGEDIQLIVVADGEEALEYVHQTHRHAGAPIPSLIVLDLNLPKSDGGDVLRTIRTDSAMASVPVVILTSSNSPKDKKTIENLGADRYLTKPSELDAFLELGGTLMEFVNRGKRADSTGAC